MIAGVGVAVALAGAVVWGLAHNSRVDTSSTAATAPPPSIAETASAAPSSSAGAPWHVQVRVIPPSSMVDVDDVNAVVSDGSVDVTGDLGSVHKVHLRSGGRETTVEVIIAEDGARPHTVALPEPRAGAGGATVGAPRKGVASPPPAPVTTQPSPAKSATRFDTRFE